MIRLESLDPRKWSWAWIWFVTLLVSLLGNAIYLLDDYYNGFHVPLRPICWEDHLGFIHLEGETTEFYHYYGRNRGRIERGYPTMIDTDGNRYVSRRWMTYYREELLWNGTRQTAEAARQEATGIERTTLEEPTGECEFIRRWVLVQPDEGGSE